MQMLMKCEKNDVYEDLLDKNKLLSENTVWENVKY